MIVRVAAAGLLVLTLLACVPSDPGSGTSSAATVRAYLPTSPVSLSLIGKTSDSNSEILAMLISDSLVQFDGGLNLQPQLAESWEFSEDHRRLTLRLRPGITWHDGAPVTSRDVLYTVAMVRDPKLQNRTYGPLFAEDRVHVEALDEHTVRVQYDRPSPEDLEMWRLPIVPEHLASLEARPGDGSAAALIDSEFSRHPVGCGPFRFVRQEVDQQIVLEANDSYWGGRPAIDRLVIKVFPEQRTAYQALLSGELDIMPLTPTLWEEARRSEATGRLEGFVYYRMTLYQITWNQDGSNPFFVDPRVRRAMTLALDRQGFNDSLIGGLARPGVTSVHPDSPLADRSLSPLPYDPDEARRLLAEAGWIDSDGDGVRDKDGRRFAFEYLYPHSSQQIVDQMAAWAQQAWADVGLDARITKLEWQAFRERRNARQFEAAAFVLSFTPTAENLYSLHHSSARRDGWNFAGLQDARLDRLLEEARLTFDDERRRELYLQLQRELRELEPISPLFHFPTPVLHDRRLQGVTPSPIDYWRTTEGPQNWRWVEPDPGGVTRAAR